MSAEVADVLDKAAQLVEAGWCKGAMTDIAGNVCAVGAINAAQGHNPLKYGPLTAEAVRLAEKSLPKWHRDRLWDLSEFNDAERRKASEVATVLRSAAATERTS